MARALLSSVQHCLEQGLHTFRTRHEQLAAAPTSASFKLPLWRLSRTQLVSALRKFKDSLYEITERARQALTFAKTLRKIYVELTSRCTILQEGSIRIHFYDIGVKITYQHLPKFNFEACIQMGDPYSSIGLTIEQKVVLNVCAFVPQSFPEMYLRIDRHFLAGWQIVSICLLKVREGSRVTPRNDEKEQTLDSPQFQPHPNRESGTSIFSFSGTTTLVSYVPKKKKENR
ncbi:hypothetical protein LAZ67_19002010 [Cordylochernes scorpioides]|uniref:Uncharacterized protein n=1 Tax=Cordylochernes scorpioides TaxID=51811 RepID=A0ABY6LJ36_9ARAC|nr:hypothetical protein LAZ67_19002010 [Cordylochernes scorpioides]